MTEANAGGEAVLISRLEGAVAIIELNDPARRNALTSEIKSLLGAAIHGAIADPAVHALMVTGRGGAFCAGADVASLDDRAAVSTRARVLGSQSWLLPLLACDKPVITAIDGPAAGAGFALALAGDVICASHAAVFRSSFLGIGAVPDLGLAYLLPRAIGRYRARDILLRNKRVDAAEAADLGIVVHLSQPDKLFEEALAIATELGSAPYAVGLAKRLLNRGEEMSLEAFLEFEAAMQSVAFGSEDFAEGVTAFREKRRPAFASH